MESILYELRHHTIGLNCGIWDYSASIISLFGSTTLEKEKEILNKPFFFSQQVDAPSL